MVNWVKTFLRPSALTKGDITISLGLISRHLIQPITLNHYARAGCGPQQDRIAHSVILQCLFKNGWRLSSVLYRDRASTFFQYCFMFKWRAQWLRKNILILMLWFTRKFLSVFSTMQNIIVSQYTQKQWKQVVIRKSVVYSSQCSVCSLKNREKWRKMVGYLLIQWKIINKSSSNHSDQRSPKKGRPKREFKKFNEMPQSLNTGFF